MPITLKQTKLFFVSMVLLPLLLAVFVAIIVGVFIRSAFDPVIAILSEPTGIEATAPATSVSLIPVIAVACVFLIGVLFVAAMMVLRKAILSKKAIERCSQNGTVIVEPAYSLSIAQYLYSKVVVDLSRTNFANYDTASFPLEKIHRLVEVRIRESSIPDNIIHKLPQCKSLRKLDLLGSALSNEAAQHLCQLSGVEFVVDDIVEEVEIVEAVV